MEVKSMAEMFAEMQNVWSKIQEQNDVTATEVKKIGEETGETKSQFAKLNERYDLLEVAIQKKLREAVFHGMRDASEPSAERKAFGQLMRVGWHGLEEPEKKLVTQAKKGDMEAKVLTTGDSATAGYLAPPEFVAEIIKPLLQFSPVRQYANVRTTSNRSIQIPIRKGNFSATWVAEIGTRTETTGLKYGLEELPNHEMYAEVLISQQDLEDAAFDMDAQIMMEASEQFGIAEGKAFVNGDGSGKPFGIVTDTNIIANQVKNVGSSSALVYAGMVDFVHSLATPYAANATMGMTRATMGAVRKLVDSQGRPLWDPSLAPGNPSTVLGYPVVEMPDMDQIGSNKYPIVFGDFKRGYTICDRVQMVVQILREKYAEQGQVAYIIRKRVGGQVVLYPSFVLLKNA